MEEEHQGWESKDPPSLSGKEAEQLAVAKLQGWSEEPGHQVSKRSARHGERHTYCKEIRTVGKSGGNWNEFRAWLRGWGFLERGSSGLSLAWKDGET